jgi:hypothetical protein
MHINLKNKISTLLYGTVLTSLILTGSSLASPNPYVFGGSSASLNLLPSAGFSASLGMGTGDVIGDLGVRGTVNLAFAGSLSAFGLDVDAILPFPNKGYTPYAGLGVGFATLSYSSVSASDWMVRGLLGVDFPINSHGRIFVEAVPTYDFPSVGKSEFQLGARLGLKINLND